MLAKHQAMAVRGVTGDALDRILSKVARGADRRQPLYNISPFTFQKLLGDPADVASNLVAYMRGFSPLARDIFDKFEFETEIQKLDEANRLFLILKEFCSPQIDLSPRRISNLQMGYVFEDLVRRFNEQANEDAGDHFTPRKVIRLMVNLVFDKKTDVFTPGIYRTIYDPTAGTGGSATVTRRSTFTTCSLIHPMAWSGGRRRILSGTNTTRWALPGALAQGCRASTTGRCSFSNT